MSRTRLLLGAGVGSLLLAAGGLAYWVASSSPDAAPVSTAPPPWFCDVTEQVGLHFIHDAGPTDAYFMPQSLGSGAALFDFDNDGLLDIYLLQNGGPSGATNCLYRQLPGGQFQDVSKDSGLDFAGYNMGVAIGDIDNDGLPDVLVTQYGGVRLLLNRGKGKFTDVTGAAGLDNPQWATSACFVDYDRDGWLDLVVVNYVDYDPAHHCVDQKGKRDFCAPHPFTGAVTKLYHNRGKRAEQPSVHFDDVTLPSGLGRFPGPGLGVACADFDRDGWPDIFVTNDGKPNHLWINQHGDTFKEEALVRGLALDNLGQARANMGIALGDVDGDGAFDVFVTHVAEEQHTLWQQGPRGMFRDRTAAAKLTADRRHGTGFGTVFADFDHDGALDLAVVNGHIRRMPFTTPDAAATRAQGPFWSWYAQPNQLFVNDGTGRFRDVSADTEPFCAHAAVSRGLAWGDVDGDGAVDLLVTAIAGPARLYRNVAPRRGHWLLVRAVDPALKRDAYGAEIRVEAAGRQWVRRIHADSSYLCSSDPRAHFGLGPADHVDAIHVRWPDGTAETFPGRAADQVVLLQKGEGQAVSPAKRESPP